MLQILALLCLLCSIANGFNMWNDPKRILGPHYQKNLASLPRSGRVTTPWSGSYWPSHQGGIAYRWNGNPKQGFGYHLYSQAELRQLSTAQLKGLSPAEKYDILKGKYNYPTVRSEWARTRPNAPRWEGLCHGWAPASAAYYQPNPVSFRNQQGIPVHFGAADVKGLLTYFMGMYASPDGTTESLGARCQGAGGSACSDMDAGAWHILLTNMLGLKRQSFIIDIDNSYQVWNQALASYSSKVNGNTVSSDIEYTVETPQKWTAHPAKTEHQKLTYLLHLTRDKSIVGGQHYVSNRNKQLDFAWSLRAPRFGGYMATLGQIYRASIGSGVIAHGLVEPDRDGLVALMEDDRYFAANHSEWIDEMYKYEPQPWLGASAGDFKKRDVLTAEAASFGLSEYHGAERQSWVINPKASYVTNSSLDIISAKENPWVELSFEQFKTETGLAFAKIYEGAHCDGPLVRAFHGHKLPQPVTLKAPFCVAFTSNRRTRHDLEPSQHPAYQAGFQAEVSLTPGDKEVLKPNKWKDLFKNKNKWKGGFQASYTVVM